MFKDNIVVQITKDGQPLREMEGKYVYLPFDSEYAIQFQNRTWRKAVAQIKIDGTDVMGGDELILSPNTTCDIERFLVDGNMNNGKKFKFVPLSNSKVQDPGSSENGLVEIEIWFEKPKEVLTKSAPVKHIPNNDPWTVTRSAGPMWSYTSNNSSAKGNIVPDGSIMYCSAPMNMSSGHYTDSNTYSQELSMDAPAQSQAGATVEGGRSNQSFVTGHFGEKDYPSVTFRFWLRGAVQEVTNQDKLYCSNCGKKVRFDYKFCPRCGSPVQKA